jgi:hypothetical protein
VKTINEGWEKMLVAQKDRKEALDGELHRQEKLAGLFDRFEEGSNRIENWQSLKQVYLETDEVVQTINVARILQSALKGFEEEYKVSEGEIEALRLLANEIIDDKYKDSGAVSERIEGIETQHKRLGELLEAKKSRLESHVKRFDEKCKEFAEASKDFNDYLSTLHSQIDALEGEPSKIISTLSMIYNTEA